VTGSAQYDPLEYWRRRLGDESSLSTVGLLGAGLGYNTWLYAVRRAVLLRTLRRLGVSVAGRAVLELGVGTGFYVPIWERMGASRIVGLDITHESVRLLGARYRPHTFLVQDIGTRFSLGEQFGIVTAFDVLFHIVDDDKHRAALENAVAHTEPGGYLLVTDVLLRGASPPTAPHVRFRPRRAYEATLSHLGMDLVGSTPVFVSMVSACDRSSAGLGTIPGCCWRLARPVLTRLRGWQQDTAGYLLGAAAYPAELALTAAATHGPSTELFVWRRRVTDSHMPEGA